MNATPYHLLLTETRARGFEPRVRARNLPARGWMPVAAADAVRGRIEGALYLVLAVALGFALGGFVLAL